MRGYRFASHLVYCHFCESKDFIFVLNQYFLEQVVVFQCFIELQPHIKLSSVTCFCCLYINATIITFETFTFAKLDSS